MTCFRNLQFAPQKGMGEKNPNALFGGYEICSSRAISDRHFHRGPETGRHRARIRSLPAGISISCRRRCVRLPFPQHLSRRAIPGRGCLRQAARRAACPSGRACPPGTGCRGSPRSRHPCVPRGRRRPSRSRCPGRAQDAARGRSLCVESAFRKLSCFNSRI